jgi:hypothetical protein
MTGLLRPLRGGRGRCGCLLGVYERYDGDVVALVDAVESGCPAGHVSGQPVPVDDVPSPIDAPAMGGPIIRQS